MFVVLLKFCTNKHKAVEFMDGHKTWIKNGFDEGIFLLAGSLQPNLGGSIIANNISLTSLQDIVNEDPFAKEGIVSAEIIEIIPSKANEQMSFLLK